MAVPGGCVEKIDPCLHDSKMNRLDPSLDNRISLIECIQANRRRFSIEKVRKGGTAQANDRNFLGQSAMLPIGGVGSIWTSGNWFHSCLLGGGMYGLLGRVVRSPPFSDPPKKQTPAPPRPPKKARIGFSETFPQKSQCQETPQGKKHCNIPKPNSNLEVSQRLSF